MMPTQRGTGGAVAVAAFGLAALVLAVGFGLTYADQRSNQSVYLIEGLRLADPGFLAHDWWAAETTHYHPAFAMLVAALHRLGPLPWSLAVLSIGFLMAAMAAVWGMARALGNDHHAAIALGTCGIFFGLYQTHTVGEATFATAGLQPSTIAATFLLVAVCLFWRRRELASGLWLAAAGAVHVNFAVLSFPLFGLAHLLLGRVALPGRLARQLGPLGIVVLVQLPTIWAVSGYDLPADVRAQAQAIFFAMVPHHYLPATFVLNFLDPLAWLLLAVPWLYLVGGDADAARRYRALFCAVAAILAVGVVLTVVVFVAPVSRLFVWRLAPLLLLLCQMTAVAAPFALLPAQRLSWPLARLAVFWLGLVLLLLVAHPGDLWRWPAARQVFGTVALLYGLLMTALVLVPGVRVALRRRLAGARGPMAALAAGVAFAVGAAAGGGYARSAYDLVAPSAELVPERALYAWARTTPDDSQFLVPLDLERFRLLAARAVVVDSKGIPFRPDELLAWHRRLTAIAPHGAAAAAGRFGYAAGYADLTPARVAALADTYGVDFAVFRRSRSVPALAAPVVFENADFVVFDLRPGRG